MGAAFIVFKQFVSCLCMNKVMYNKLQYYIQDGKKNMIYFIFFTRNDLYLYYYCFKEVF